MKAKMNNRALWVVGCVLLPLVVGGISSLLTSDAMGNYAMMERPPLSPPGWLFPVVWTILYILMGVASYLLLVRYWESRGEEKRDAKMALIIYLVQLAFNFCWSIAFFNFKFYWFALVWLLVMWVMIIMLVARSRSLSMAAMWMLVPYLVWTTFAAYLNLGTALMN